MHIPLIAKKLGPINGIFNMEDLLSTLPFNRQKQNNTCSRTVPKVSGPWVWTL